MPITAFIGVRISWLIVARNELFASLAASAAARASFASWKRRAFCNATPTLAAIVLSRRWSSASYAPSVCVLCTLITPRHASPTLMGTPRYDNAWRPTTFAPSWWARRSIWLLMIRGLPVSMILLVSPSPSFSGRYSDSPYWYGKWIVPVVCSSRAT